MLSEILRPAPNESPLSWLAAQPRSVLFSTTVTRAELFYGARMLPKGKIPKITTACRSGCTAKSFIPSNMLMAIALAATAASPVQWRPAKAANPARLDFKFLEAHGAPLLGLRKRKPSLEYGHVQDGMESHLQYTLTHVRTSKNDLAQRYGGPADFILSDRHVVSVPVGHSDGLHAGSFRRARR